ncbi:MULTISPECIES: BolA family protein [Zymobacter]|uniref:Predicted transcriptional regulator, BolA n=1 Tax=Zymobacter palmae TaxID=33074 RepID=A0A348HGV5_9GAMM|nr:BolA/IbaG family iron-sulfur metabolism protein [Zymobacter palmae]BBG30857.1 predicted transcriptional regulator, BolA [Zymobacter palmae]
MRPEDVKALLEERVEGCTFVIEGEGCNFQVTAIGERFGDLSRLKRQQLINSALSDEIASGALHALSIKTFTPTQWAELNA